MVPPLSRKKVIRVPEGLYDFTDTEIAFLHRCREKEDTDDEFVRFPAKPMGSKPDAAARYKKDRSSFVHRDKGRSRAYFGQQRDHLMDDSKSNHHEFSYSSSLKCNTSKADLSDSEDDFQCPEKESSRLEVHVPNTASSPIARVRVLGAESTVKEEPQNKPLTSKRRLLIVPEPEICDPNNMTWKEDSLDRQWTQPLTDDVVHEEDNNIPITKKIASFGRLILSSMTPDPL